MGKFSKALLTIFFLILPILLWFFVSGLANAMRWQFGSPLIRSHSFMRWSHVYLVVGSLFCFALYLPIIIGIFKKKQRMLFMSFSLTMLFIVSSVGFTVISKKIYDAQRIRVDNEGLETSPEGSLALENEANAYSNAGNYDKAIEFYNKALKVTSNPGYVIHDRGMAYPKKGELNQAILDLSKAMEINPDEKEFMAQCYNDRGAVYFYSGEYQKSWQDVQKAMELGYNVHPDFLTALKEKVYSE